MNPNPKYLHYFYNENGVLDLPSKDLIPEMWHLPLMDSLARMCAEFDIHQHLLLSYDFFEWPKMIRPFSYESLIFYNKPEMKRYRERYDEVYGPISGCTLSAASRIIWNHWRQEKHGYGRIDDNLNFWERQTSAGKIALISICLAHPKECEILLSKLGLFKIAETSGRLI